VRARWIAIALDDAGRARWRHVKHLDDLGDVLDGVLRRRDRHLHRSAIDRSPATRRRGRALLGRRRNSVFHALVREAITAATHAEVSAVSRSHALDSGRGRGLTEVSHRACPEGHTWCHTAGGHSDGSLIGGHMSATLAPSSRSALATGVDEVREACRRLLATISASDLDDRRWLATGPLVSSAALRLREAVGVATVGASDHVPPIVRERDLSMAAHRLLAHDVRVVDGDAAGEFVRLALEISLALS
jgi:hypothetical protein